MTKPTPIAALLIAAFLSGTVFCAELDRATAGQVAATASPGPSVNAPPEPRGRAYLFRGFAGMVFSRGTDKLADRIKQAGFMATVNEAMMCPKIAKEAIDDYRRDPALIILIGHSVGGACALSFAEMLQDEHIPVSLLVTTEPARISHDVPLNVERYINIYQSDSVLGGIDVAPAQGFQGHYATFDLVEHKEISHVNMEKADFLHDQVLSKILQLAATPAKADQRRRADSLCGPCRCSDRAMGQRHAGLHASRRYAANARGVLSRTALVAQPRSIRYRTTHSWCPASGSSSRAISFRHLCRAIPRLLDRRGRSVERAQSAVRQERNQHRDSATVRSV